MNCFELAIDARRLKGRTAIGQVSGNEVEFVKLLSSPSYESESSGVSCSGVENQTKIMTGVRQPHTERRVKHA